MRVLKALSKIRAVASFSVYLAWSLVLSNLRIAHDVLTIKNHMKPGVVRIPLEVATEAEIFVLANAITLTPGSLTVGISEDKTEIYVHGMFIDDAEAFKREIKTGFEKRVLRMFR